VTKNTKIAIGAALGFFILFYIGITLASGDHEIIGLGWQLLIIFGVAGVFTLFMWRSLRRR
jgi:hypothetical protein